MVRDMLCAKPRSWACMGYLENDKIFSVALGSKEN